MARETKRVLVTTQEEISKINKDNLELMEDYINYLEATDISPASITVYKSNLNIFFVYMMKYCKNKDFCEIKKRDIVNFQNYLIKNELSPARIRVLRSSISSLGIFIENILDEEEKWEDFRNIVNKIPAPNMSDVREKTILTDEQLEDLLEKLLNKNKIQIATFVAMCAYSGARKSEMVLYKRSFFTDESLQNGLYTTPEIRTKGSGVKGKLLKKYCIKNKVIEYLDLWDKERERLGITIDDLFVVKSKGEYKPATATTVNSWMKTCGDILGLDIYCHNFRHFFVSSLSRQNIPIEAIQIIVGHNSSEMTQKYDDTPKENMFMKYFSEDGVVEVKSASINEL